MMPDLLHPKALGYGVGLKQLVPYVDKYLRKQLNSQFYRRAFSVVKSKYLRDNICVCFYIVFTLVVLSMVLFGCGGEGYSSSHSITSTP